MIPTSVVNSELQTNHGRLDRIAPLKLSILTGGRDSHYALPLILSLASQPTAIDVIASDEFLTDQMVALPNVAILTFQQPNGPGTPAYKKILRLIATYLRLLAYAVRTESVIFHILWLSRAELIDTILLMPALKLLGKTLIYTAHNVDAGERDGRTSRLRYWTLRRLYRQLDHIFVHTDQMKLQIQEAFGIAGARITVVPFGLNTAVPESGLTRDAAREKLQLDPQEKVALFFGHITAYKGLEYLIEAAAILNKNQPGYVRLIIAGGVKDREAASYYQTLLASIDRLKLHSSIISHTQFIPDDEMEVYFKAADVCVLPYKTIFQTGVFFLAYRFGLPVVATDVGSIRKDVVVGRTGFICRPEDSHDLAAKLREIL